jgi:hypothetical protein
MNWLYYLIEANIYLGIFYAFYHFVLKQEPLYNINRGYLLVTPILAFIFPLLTVSYTTSIAQLPLRMPDPIVYDLRPSVTVAAQPHLSLVSSTSTVWQFEEILPFLYLTVVLCGFAITLKKIAKLVLLYKRSHKRKADGVVYLTLDGQREEIFSFFNWLFLHPKMYKNQVIIVHELIHIKQGHSYDVIFFEFLRCINWFNPCVYLLFKAAKLNHEYISDRSIVANMQNRYDYANLLIQHAYLPSENLSHSAFSKTQLEQRIIHLGKQSKNPSGRLKYVALFPLVTLLVFIAAFKVEKSYGLINFNITAHKAPVATAAPGNLATPNAISAKVKRAQVHPLVKNKANPAVPSTLVSDPQLSELVSGSTTLGEFAAEMAKKGEKLYAIDYELFWATNKANAKIRKVIHSICVGTEAQLFRGQQADTLYIDQGFYAIADGSVRINTDHLWIGATDDSPAPQKKLIVIDAAKRKIIAKLAQVNLLTKGLIHRVIRNPYFGYGKDGVVDSVPNKYVDVKKRDADRKYIANVSNIYVREARITASQIITNETKSPEEDLRQPGIIW